MERNRGVGVTGGILGRSALEESDPIPGARPRDQQLELRDESIGSPVVNRLPQVGTGLFPCCIIDVHPNSLDHAKTGCATSQPATALAKPRRQSSILIGIRPCRQRPMVSSRNLFKGRARLETACRHS